MTATPKPATLDPTDPASYCKDCKHLLPHGPKGCSKCRQYRKGGPCSAPVAGEAPGVGIIYRAERRAWSLDD